MVVRFRCGDHTHGDVFNVLGFFHLLLAIIRQGSRKCNILVSFISNNELIFRQLAVPIAFMWVIWMRKPKNLTWKIYFQKRERCIIVSLQETKLVKVDSQFALL